MTISAIVDVYDVDSVLSLCFNINGALAASTYSYDLNGNMYTDPYKKITSAKYYYHNNPKDLTINSNFLKFTYDASGTKLRKQVLNSLSQQILKQDYVSGIEYRNDTIEAIYHSDGRTVWNGSAWRYEYNVADHLGNVRAVISDLDGDKILDFTGVATTNEIINVNSYYAFGMVMQNGNFANNTTTPDTKYQYNNKEFNGDWGLNLLDYGARWYDPAVGRFTTVDPLVEEYPRWSPYNYVMNSPLRYNDPTGMSANDKIDVNKKMGNITVTKAEGKDEVRLVNDGKVESSYTYGKNGSFCNENDIQSDENGISVTMSDENKAQKFYEFAAQSNCGVWKA